MARLAFRARIAGPAGGNIPYTVPASPANTVAIFSANAIGSEYSATDYLTIQTVPVGSFATGQGSIKPLTANAGDVIAFTGAEVTIVGFLYS
jgi:hypothetical protein